MTPWARRRRELREKVSGPILLIGNDNRSRNLPMSPLPFRQDSSFLYFTGCKEPGAAVLLTENTETLFLRPHAADDALWHGETVPIETLGGTLGFDNTRPLQELEQRIAPIRPQISCLAVPDETRNRWATSLTGIELQFGTQNGPEELVDAVISLRRTLKEEELAEMRETAKVTYNAHLAAMGATRAGGHENHICAVFEATVRAAGLVTAYPSIVTVRGEVLHNFHTEHTLEDGQLLLLDGGAESPNGYATDVTRTWPVSGRFSARQRATYDAVLEAQEQSIALVRAGVRFRRVHDCSSLVIARFLADERIITCSPEEAVAQGAHALFFPHGVGHLIGLDVHDLENFGDRAGYASGRSRSTQFGTKYLRLDRDLEPGNVVTIEPGFYAAPGILHDPALREQFSKLVDFTRAEEWIGFGGIRIEDDIVVTHDAPENLTGHIPKAPEAMESLIGQSAPMFADA